MWKLGFLKMLNKKMIIDKTNTYEIEFLQKNYNIYMCMYINICNTKVNGYNTLKCVYIYI
jgi:hypothetical protein